MAKASARHILVETKEACQNLIDEINNGADFADLAKQHSKCPSGNKGGALDEFGPGQMVPELDKVIFNEEVGKPHGPVKTNFGYHIVEVTSRTE